MATAIDTNDLDLTTLRFPYLFQEGKIGRCILQNRFIMSLYPTKYSTDSRVNERIIEFYRERACGGVSMIVLDCPCLDFPRVYKGTNELRFDTPEYTEGIINLLKAIHAEGAKAFMQLNYPAERSFSHEVPGAKKKGDGWVVPLVKCMTSDEAEDILNIMADGAKKARALGYDGIEIQASYGDFISQLLSQLTNKRTDEYGGNLENRARFLTTLIKKVKQKAGEDYPVMIKLVCDEFVPGGLTLKDTTVIARLIEQAGGDAILATGGNKATKQRTIPPHSISPGSLVELAWGIKKTVSIPVIAVGKINTPYLAEKIIREDKADFIAMTRALIAEPYLPAKAMAGRVEDIRGCVYCLEDCAEKGVPVIGRACAVNPFAGQEYLFMEHFHKVLPFRITPAAKKKKVVIIGGGPAGMQSAILASQRGHEVILYERHRLGGQLCLASLSPFKEEMGEALRFLKHSLSQTQTKVILGREITGEEILSQNPNSIVIATGSRPAFPDIPGIKESSVFDARTIYEKEPDLGEQIVIIGGGDIGCETADYLSSGSHKITIIESLDKVLRNMKDIPRQELLKRLEQKGVIIITETKVIEVAKGKVIAEDKGRNRIEIKADSVISAIGSTPENSLYESLKDKVSEIYIAGDASKTGNLGTALRSGCEIGLKI